MTMDTIRQLEYISTETKIAHGIRYLESLNNMSISSTTHVYVGAGGSFGNVYELFFSKRS